MAHEIALKWQGRAHPAFKLKWPFDTAGARAQASQCLDDQREAAGEIVAWTTIEPHSLTILAGNDSESIVLNLMQPQAAGRQRVSFGGKARRNEAGLVGPLRCADERATIARRAAP
jgi:hypothetical protein